MATTYDNPGSLDLNVIPGDTFNKLLTFSSDPAGATPIDLSLYHFVCNVGDENETVVPVTITGTDLAHGKVTISLTAAQTQTLMGKQSYGWYFRWTDPVGNVKTIIQGRMNLGAI